MKSSYSRKNVPRTLVIAEIGECFNGSLAAAKRLMHEAQKAGCDIIKFQTLDCESINPHDSEREWFLKIALNPEKIRHLAGYAQKMHMRILFTPENIKTAQWLIDARLQEVKIASSSLADTALIRFVNNSFKRVFISTGMAALGEIKKAVSMLKDVSDLYIMHCISEYPTGPLLEKRGLRPLAEENTRLNMMKMLIELFPDKKIGYSDHTQGILAPILAVAGGARVIEKHITLDRETPVSNFRMGGEYLGTDHILSIEPTELKKMVSEIRKVERMLGEWKWERSEGENLLRKFLRKRFSGG